MKRLGYVVAACVALLVGCQHFPQNPRRGLEGFDPGVVRPPQPLFPNVFVTDAGFLVVDQEPIRLGKRDIVDGRFRISWALAAGSPDTFPANGIVIGPGPTRDTPQDLRCAVQGSLAKVFECSFRAPEQRFRYKYTVYVRRGEKQLEALDPLLEGNY